MNKHNRGVRLFSVWRLLVSCALGLILPLSYAIALSQLDRYLEPKTSYLWASPFLWPKPLWVFVTGLQPSDENFASGLAFIAVCNFVLYGLLIYVALTALKALKHKPADPVSPPSPHPSLQL